MAKKYMVFIPSNFEDAQNKLTTIGITLEEESTGYYNLTFSDGQSVHFNYGPANWNNIIIADDSTDLFMVSQGKNAIENTYKNTETDAQVHFAYVFVAKTIDDTLYVNDGYNNGFSTSYIMEVMNTTSLSTSDLTQNISDLQDLDLIQLVGSLWMYPSDHPKTRYIFKHCYINYKRWFPFGTIIVDSNGNEYIANGWVLCRVNIDS